MDLRSLLWEMQGILQDFCTRFWGTLGAVQCARGLLATPFPLCSMSLGVHLSAPRAATRCGMACALCGLAHTVAAYDGRVLMLADMTLAAARRRCGTVTEWSAPSTSHWPWLQCLHHDQETLSHVQGGSVVGTACSGVIALTRAATV